MMRVLQREKKNKKSGFTQRLRWYESSYDVRIQIEDCDGRFNYITTDKLDAMRVWDEAKEMMSESGGPIHSKLVELGVI